MENDRYRLDSLEPRLLLSGDGILEQAASLIECPLSATRAVEEYTIDEEVYKSNVSGGTYIPGNELSDLFDTGETISDTGSTSVKSVEGKPALKRKFFQILGIRQGNFGSTWLMASIPSHTPIEQQTRSSP